MHGCQARWPHPLLHPKLSAENFDFTLVEDTAFREVLTGNWHGKTEASPMQR